MRLPSFLLGSLGALLTALPFTACASSPSCDALESTAQTELASAQKGYVACQVDSDCVWTPVTRDGWCAAACGGLTSKASAASFVEKAASVCQEFDTHGCAPPVADCPASGPFLCAAGTCALYTLSLGGPTTAITHGVCTAFEVNYSIPGGSTLAPHDVTVTVSATGGTLYADAACTTPLTTGTVTIAGGAHAARLGFEAQAAGQFSIAAGQAGGSYVAE